MRSSIFHFTLFVRACVETKQRNRSRSAFKYEYMYTPGGGRPYPVQVKDTNPREATSSDVGNWNDSTVHADSMVVPPPSVGIASVAPTAMSEQTATVIPHSPPTVYQQQHSPPLPPPLPRSRTASGEYDHHNNDQHIPLGPMEHHDYPPAPPSVYQDGVGDGFEGYRGPTDQADLYNMHWGQKEIIPDRIRRVPVGGRGQRRSRDEKQ